MHGTKLKKFKRHQIGKYTVSKLLSKQRGTAK